MTEEDLSEAEREILKQALGMGSPIPEEKNNVHTFLNKIMISNDTAKTGFLKEEELGMPKHPIRTYKELALFCEEIADMNYFADYFKKKSEIVTSTSLSRDGFFDKLAVVQKRVIEDATKLKTKNKGWFRKKDEPEKMEEV